MSEGPIVVRPRHAAGVKMSIPIPWTININPSQSGAGDAPANFHPAEITIAVGDQVHWANNDHRKHWPGLLYNGELQKQFFMRNEIAPKSPSDNWTPAGPGTYQYECSLHAGERGTIVVQ